MGTVNAASLGFLPFLLAAAREGRITVMRWPVLPPPPFRASLQNDPPAICFGDHEKADRCDFKFRSCPFGDVGDVIELDDGEGEAVALRVTSVRLERLHNLTPEQQRYAFGTGFDLGWDVVFRVYWSMLHQHRAPWTDKPAVWRVEFERVTPPRVSAEGPDEEEFDD